MAQENKTTQTYSEARLKKVVKQRESLYRAYEDKINTVVDQAYVDLEKTVMSAIEKYETQLKKVVTQEEQVKKGSIYDLYWSSPFGGARNISFAKGVEEVMEKFEMLAPDNRGAGQLKVYDYNLKTGRKLFDDWQTARESYEHYVNKKRDSLEQKAAEVVTPQVQEKPKSLMGTLVSYFK